MSHFAELDENNIVIRVIVGDNNKPNEGLDWILENLAGRWVQTSYNANFRKKYAGPGDTYNEELDAFIPPRPYPSWVLDNETAKWKAPIDYPGDGKVYVWDEDSQSWLESEG